MSDWKALFRRVNTNRGSGTRPLPPTQRDMIRYEKRIGFRFPDSYREYAAVFGSGTLAEYFRICVPRRKGAARSSGDLEDLHGYLERVSDSIGEWCGDADFARRMVAFGDTLGGDLFAWDPLDVRDCDSFEYGIYVLARSHEPLHEISGQFSEFIHEVCFGTRFFDLLKMKNDGPVRKTFEPFGIKA